MAKNKTQKASSWTPQIQKKAPSLAPPPIVVQRDPVSPETEVPMPDYTPLPADAVENHPLMRKLSAQPIQAKLTIGAPGDKYEQEADQVARKVVSQINSPVARNENGEPGQIQTKPAISILQRLSESNKTISPFAGGVQRQEAIAGGDASQDLESSINRARGGGQPLDGGLQRSMGQAMGADFSGVRVHTDAQSDQLNRSIQAKAFTTGQDVFFRQGAYQPGSRGGQELIAHELTHVVQQNSGTVQRQSTNNQGWKSPALQLRSQLQNSSLSSLVIQRKVETSGGEWDTDKYDLITPATPSGLRGVDIELKFKPGDYVDAELIGLTQSVKSIKSKKPHFINNDAFYKDISIESNDAITVDSITGETDEGSIIDRVKEYNNPIYPVNSLPSASLDDTSTSPGWGQHGYHYKNQSGVLKHKNAILKDKPQLVRAEKESGQIFETTALATKGTQAGTYYGSVRWGWRTDSKGNFTNIPLTKVSEGVPSSTFMKAATIWNAAKNSTGDDTVNLPIVDVKVTTAPITGVYPANFVGPPLQIPTGTRVQIIRNATPPSTNGTIKVVDGPFTGNSLEVTPTDMNTLTDERP